MTVIRYVFMYLSSPLNFLLKVATTLVPGCCLFLEKYFQIKPFSVHLLIDLQYVKNTCPERKLPRFACFDHVL